MNLSKQVKIWKPIDTGGGQVVASTLQEVKDATGFQDIRAESLDDPGFRRKYRIALSTGKFDIQGREIFEWDGVYVDKPAESGKHYVSVINMTSEPQLKKGGGAINLTDDLTGHVQVLHNYHDTDYSSFRNEFHVAHMLP